MASQKANNRKNHHRLSIIVYIPLILMTLTGMTSPILEALQLTNAAQFVRQVHSGRIFLGSAYLIYTGLTALGLLGLLVTGFRMLRLFERPKSL
jgi:uncharacterized iron-regulated membrane protein